MTKRRLLIKVVSILFLLYFTIYIFSNYSRSAAPVLSVIRETSSSRAADFVISSLNLNPDVAMGRWSAGSSDATKKPLRSSLAGNEVRICIATSELRGLPSKPTRLSAVGAAMANLALLLGRFSTRYSVSVLYFPLENRFSSSMTTTVTPKTFPPAPSSSPSSSSSSSSGFPSQAHHKQQKKPLQQQQQQQQQKLQGANDSDWQQRYLEQNVQVLVIDDRVLGVHNSSRPVDIELSASFRLYRWLSSHENDCHILHYPAEGGLGFHTAQAKHQGSHFHSITLVSHLHAPRLLASNEQPHPFLPVTKILNPGDLIVDHLERTSVRFSDLAIAPSHSLFSFVDEQLHWTSPTNRLVLPDVYLRSQAFLPPPTPSHEFPSQIIQEFVYVGVLDQSNDLQLFLDAIDVLIASATTLPPRIGVLIIENSPTELVPRHPSTLMLTEYLQARTSAWPPSLLVHIDVSISLYKALRYLTAPRMSRVAVSISLFESLPFVAQEMLFDHLPFIAPALGSAPELLDEQYRNLVFFSPLTPEALSNKMLLFMLTSQIVVGEPAVSPSQTQERWIDLHEDLFELGPSRRRALQDRLRLVQTLPVEPTSVIVYHDLTEFVSPYSATEIAAPLVRTESLAPLIRCLTALQRQSFAAFNITPVLYFDPIAFELHSSRLVQELPKKTILDSPSESSPSSLLSLPPPLPSSAESDQPPSRSPDQHRSPDLPNPLKSESPAESDGKDPTTEPLLVSVLDPERNAKLLKWLEIKFPALQFADAPLQTGLSEPNDLLNQAARQSTANSLIFLSSDDEPMDHEIKALITAQRFSQSHVLLVNSATRPVDTMDQRFFLFPGGPVSASVLLDVFGPCHFLVQRNLFVDLGGFPSVQQTLCKPGMSSCFQHQIDSNSFIVRALLNGMSIEQIPEPLYFRRAADLGKQMDSTSTPLIGLSHPLTDDIRLLKGFDSSLRSVAANCRVLLSDPVVRLLFSKGKSSSSDRKAIKDSEFLIANCLSSLLNLDDIFT